MSQVSITSATRKNWTTEPLPGTDYPGDKNMIIGCLQRIADATELMAKRHLELISTVESQKKSIEWRDAKIETLKKSNAALRGHIKRLKRKTV